MLLQSGDELQEVRRALLFEQASALRALDAEPRVLPAHQAAHARERQAVEAQRLAAARAHHVNRPRRERDDALHELARRLRRVAEEPRRGRVEQFVQRGHAERSEEHTSELQSRQYLVCRLLLEKKKKTPTK